jgi:hypothetical protein
MNVLDSLVALIDNGGTRDAADRRKGPLPDARPERRSVYDRRSGADRRRILNDKRRQGIERRTIFFKKLS